MVKKAGDLGIYHCSSRIRPGQWVEKAFAQGFLRRTLQSEWRFGWICLCPALNGTIVLLNTARMEKYAQLLAQKRRGLKVEGLARNRSAA
jgi:hypothetical protein